MIINSDGESFAGWNDASTWDSIAPGGAGVTVTDVELPTVTIIVAADNTSNNWMRPVAGSPAPNMEAQGWVLDSSPNRTADSITGFLRWVTQNVYNLGGKPARVVTPAGGGLRG